MNEDTGDAHWGNESLTLSDAALLFGILLCFAALAYFALTWWKSVDPGPDPNMTKTVDAIAASSLSNFVETFTKSVETCDGLPSSLTSEVAVLHRRKGTGWLLRAFPYDPKTYERFGRRDKERNAETAGIFVLVNERAKVTGRYSDGQAAKQLYYEIIVVDRKRPCILDSVTFWGKKPPSEKFRGSDGAGVSPDAELASWLEKRYARGNRSN